LHISPETGSLDRESTEKSVETGSDALIFADASDTERRWLSTASDENAAEVPNRTIASAKIRLTILWKQGRFQV
jgi:hypothetical protein